MNQSQTSESLFSQILAEALKLGVIDIFRVIYYQVNSIPSDQIIQELQAKILEQRSV